MEDDLVGGGLTDLYYLYSALFTFWLNAQDKGYNVKFLTNKIAELPESPDANIKPAKNVRLLTRDSLMQVLIDTPIRKQLFIEWLQKQGGQRA